MPVATTQPGTAVQVQDLFGTPQTGVGSQPGAGLSGTGGLYGSLGELPQYKDVNYTYKDLPVIKSKSSGGQIAEKMGYILAQERQAGIQRNLGRRDSVLGGFDQRIANSRELADNTATQEDAFSNALLGDVATQYNAANNQVQDAYTGAGNTLNNDFNLGVNELSNRYDRNMGYVNAMGESERARLDRDYAAKAAAARQSANRRGLSNSTITDALGRGINLDRNLSRMDLEDRLLKNRLTTDASLSQDKANAIIGRGTAMSGLKSTAAGAQQQMLGQGLNAGVQIGSNYLGALRNRNSESMAREAALTGDRMGFLAGYEDAYPTLADSSTMFQQSGVLDQADKALAASIKALKAKK